MKFSIDVIQILAFLYFALSTLANYSYKNKLIRTLFVYAKCQVGSNLIINREPGTSVWLVIQ